MLAGLFNYFASPLVDTCAGGQVSYEPIPFQNSVRIETENKELPTHPSWHADRHYYQYTYLKFPPGTALDSYTGTLTSQQQTARASVVSMFNNPGIHPAGSSATAIDVNLPGMDIEPLSTVTVADLGGPGILRKLNIRMDDANDNELEALRLRVYYDGNDTPAIDVSVGNFFGAGKGRALYKSLPLGTDSPDGFYCYWPMPFRDSLVIKLYNTMDANISVNSTIVQYEPDANVEKMCYLYAVENSSVKQSGDIYHPILSRTGCGHYVGNLLYIEQESYSFAMLEGDEVITVDGTNVLKGTGLEDAYNGGYYYNWVATAPCEPEGSEPQSAIRPLSGILYVHREAGVEYARADQYRWQIADCVPFSQSIEVKIENRYSINANNQWTSVAFWYQNPCVVGDLDNDCDVDFFDFADFSSYWLQSNCQDPNWCGGADFDESHDVNGSDLATFVKHWL